MVRQHRRHFMASLLALGLAGAGIGPAMASSYPDKPVTFVVPYPAGGATDMLARIMAQQFTESWKVPVVVENRAGAGGTIGASSVVRGAPDGYTVLFTIVALVQQIPLMKLPYDPLKDLAPLTRVASSPSILAVTKDIPVKTLPEFISYAKTHDGKLNYGTYSAGTSSHLQMSLLSVQYGLNMTHIPYKGAAPLVSAMMGRHVDAALLDAASSRSQLSSFTLLGVTGTERLSWLPNVPTLKEQGAKSFEPLGWFGLFMPSATPQAIQTRFTDEAIRILKKPDVRQRIEDLGLIAGGDTQAAFKELVVRDAKVYADIVREAKVTLD